jgi:hypothetical protein
MKWLQIYLVGYAILMAGAIAALWKLGVLERVGTTWTLIGIVVAIGLGIMIAVTHSTDKKTIEIEDKN